MNVLGINFLSEASAALIQDGKVVSAVSEERFNRIKLYYGYPVHAVNFVLQNSKLTIKDIDIIATTGLNPGQPNVQAFREKEGAIKSSHLNKQIKEQQIQELWKRYRKESIVLSERTPTNIKQLKKLGPKVVAVDHHLAHAASAYYCSGFDKCVIITCDGWGENSSNILCLGENGELEQLQFSHTFDSVGYYYGSVTKFLGFTPQRHEGKVLGLAAYGNPDLTTPIMRKMISFDKKNQRFVGKLEDGIYLPSFDNVNLSRVMTLGTTNTSQNIFTREDISAGLQHVLEEVVIQYVDNLNFGDINLAVAGGIFANVKLNQKIARLPQIKNFFVYPNMGDGGLAVGSALLIYAQEYRLMPNKINDVYLGPEFSEDNILSEIKNQDVQYEKIDDIEIEIAELLVKGNIVARFNGRMEFGPRALGNRSILYTPTDKSVNEWLNKKLQRSEFMPFAPVTIKEIASKCYDEYNKEQIAANFMTITYNCTEYMKKTQPAVIHIDGTARPQIISEKINPSYYKIVKKFYELTDIPSLVNTSFNMHEDPIVCTPSDAIHAFKKGHLNYLAIGNFILKN